MRLRVVWGLGETMATFWPTSVLTSVDLPALGRPTIATKPDLKGMEELIVRLLRVARKVGASARDLAEEVKTLNTECTEKRRRAQQKSEPTAETQIAQRKAEWCETARIALRVDELKKNKL
jgi:hypothetical protein